MDWIKGLQDAIDYVEEHLTEPIDYDSAIDPCPMTQLNNQ